MNVDTQEVNIVVDKDNIEVKNDIANSGNIVEKPTKNVEVETQTEQTEQPLDSGMNTGSIDAGTEKPLEAQVYIEAEKPVVTEKPKPLLVEMQT